MNSSADAPRSTLPLLALAVVLAGLGFGIYAAMRPAPAISMFNLDGAMHAAGEHVPEQIESFYFFVPEAARSEDEEVSELAGLLKKAALEKDYFGVAGPDAERNRSELLSALKRNRSDGLQGLVLVYLGPEVHRTEVESAVTGSGASVRFVIYPPLPKDSV